MVIGLLFALLAVACGLAVNRVVRAPPSLAPLTGLASIAVLTVWCTALGAPPLLGTAFVVILALLGVALSLSSLRALARVSQGRWPLLVLAVGAAIPALLLGTALAGVDAPVSTHDGAFHVETIDSLRRGVSSVQVWYPIGFHTSAAAVLGLAPWLDSARGTIEVALGLAILAPLGLFALGLGIGLRPLQASTGAVVLSLTYIFPYDDHLWGGWPLAMSIVLLLGLWATALHWIVHPTPTLAVVAGLLAGAIVLTHGTEVYSAIVGLAVIAAVRWRCLKPAQLVRHLPLVGAFALVCALPYVSVLVGWAGGGGATSTAVAALNDLSAHPVGDAGGDWLEFVLGVTGAASLIDLPVRAVLLGMGVRGRHMGVVVAGWAVFSALLLGTSFLDLEPIRWFYVGTFPWLVRHRPPQLVVLFASMLIARGLATTVGWVWSLRARLAPHPRAWRRLVVLGGIVLAFFAEGSAISIYKTLDQVIGEQNTFSPDDRAAMGWLEQHAQPGDVVVNDQAADAGIWAPYKGGMAVLLPRSGSGSLLAERMQILTHLLDLRSAPDALKTACALHVGYVYAGARPVPGDEHRLPSLATLAGAADLQEVFSSGEAVIFRLHLACGRALRDDRGVQLG